MALGLEGAALFLVREIANLQLYGGVSSLQDFHKLLLGEIFERPTIDTLYDIPHFESGKSCRRIGLDREDDRAIGSPIFVVTHLILQPNAADLALRLGGLSFCTTESQKECSQS